MQLRLILTSYPPASTSQEMGTQVCASGTRTGPSIQMHLLPCEAFMAFLLLAQAVPSLYDEENDSNGFIWLLQPVSRQSIDTEPSIEDQHICRIPVLVSVSLNCFCLVSSNSSHMFNMKQCNLMS